MKTSIFLAIISLSLNMIAQNYHPLTASIAKTSEIQETTDRLVSDNYPGRYHGLTTRNQISMEGSIIQIIDSIYYWDSPDPETGLNVVYKISNMLYDANNNLTSKLMRQWNGIAWVNQYKYSYGYNASNKMTSAFIQGWFENDWVNFSQYNYGYDANNNLATEILQQWNDNLWENQYFITYTYDINHNMTSELFQTWTGSAWKNSYLDTWTYDNHNNPETELNQFWNGSGWMPYSMFEYFFNASNMMTSALYQRWNNNSWEDKRLYTYTYGIHNNMTTEFVQEFNNSIWENYSLRTFDYDPNDNQVIDFLQGWNGSAWVNEQRITCTYNDDNFMVSRACLTWNEAGTEIIFGDSTCYYFHTALGFDELVPLEMISVYPNPCNGKFTVHYESPVDKIEIYNMTGDLIYACNRINHQTTGEIDLTYCPKGVYIIKINTGAKIRTGKIISQ